MKASKQARAGIIYQGPSAIDGAPIVAIAIAQSSNSKTGDMVQTYIIRADVDPVSAVRTLADVSICGTCKHRGRIGFTDRSCYVNVGQGPNAIFRALMKGRYPTLNEEQTRAIGAGRMVRLGTYGDPFAVPVAVWRALIADAIGHTGYTHTWRDPAAQALRDLCMASADTDDERAQAQGWRTFRVRMANEPIAPREFKCPASAEMGHRVTCADCRACNGTATGRKGSPTTIAHGAFARRFALNQSRLVE